MPNIIVLKEDADKPDLIAKILSSLSDTDEDINVIVIHNDYEQLDQELAGYCLKASSLRQFKGNIVDTYHIKSTKNQQQNRWRRVNLHRSQKHLHRVQNRR